MRFMGIAIVCYTQNNSSCRKAASELIPMSLLS